MKSINTALKPVAEFTDVLSGEKYVTVSSVKPVLGRLKRELLSPDSNDTTLTANIKKIMCSVLGEKYSPTALQELLRKATLLKLRYRGNIGDAVVMEDDTKDQLLKKIVKTRGTRQQ